MSKRNSHENKRKRREERAAEARAKAERAGDYATAWGDASRRLGELLAPVADAGGKRPLRDAIVELAEPARTEATILALLVGAVGGPDPFGGAPTPGWERLTELLTEHGQPGDLPDDVFARMPGPERTEAREILHRLGMGDR